MSIPACNLTVCYHARFSLRGVLARASRETKNLRESGARIVCPRRTEAGSATNIGSARTEFERCWYMAGNSKIEWTEKTWNPINGCRVISPGCERCYAQTMASRFAGPGLPYAGLTQMTSAGPRWTGEVRLMPHLLLAPLSWRKPTRIFVNSMSDLYYDGIPQDYLAQIWDVMRRTPHHTYQVLTKRSRRMAELTHGMSIPKHVWMGVSVESDDYLHRVDDLRAVPAQIRFLSIEPLLAPLSRLDLTGISWVIVGGESGPAARPMDADWVRRIRDQCISENVAFFFKQWGGQFKGRNGRTLDGRTWDQFPDNSVVSRTVLPVLNGAHPTRFDIMLDDDYSTASGVS